MTKSERGAILNANQRRHYEVLFAGLEQALARIERLVSPTGAPLTLTTYRDDLPATAGTEILSHVAVLRSEIAALTRELALQSREVSRRQSIRALLTSEVIRLEESTSSHLHGYGTVDQSVGRIVDPLLAAIRNRLGSISAALKPEPEARRPRSDRSER